MKVVKDTFGQVELKEEWEYKFLSILEDICTPPEKTEHPDKTLTAYMADLLELIPMGRKVNA